MKTGLEFRPLFPRAKFICASCSPPPQVSSARHVRTNTKQPALPRNGTGQSGIGGWSRGRPPGYLPFFPKFDPPGLNPSRNDDFSVGNPSCRRQPSRPSPLSTRRAGARAHQKPSIWDLGTRRFRQALPRPPFFRPSRSFTSWGPRCRPLVDVSRIAKSPEPAIFLAIQFVPEIQRVHPSAHGENTLCEAPNGSCKRFLQGPRFLLDIVELLLRAIT